MKTCFLFPGQGAQYPGMGKDLWETSAVVREMFEHAAETTKVDVKRLLFEGTEEELKVTDKTQIAVTLMNLSVAEVLEERGWICDGAAGFSLGEFSALTEAGVIHLDDVFPIVKIRGEIMNHVANSHNNGSGGPGMAAVIGLTYDQIQQIIREQEIANLYAANNNAPQQVVLAGTYDALNKAEEVCKSAGAKRFVKLRVSAPFHSPLMEEARKEIADVLEEYQFEDPKKPVYSNVSADLIKSGEEAKRLCIRQIVSTVRWVDVQKKVLADGYNRCVECGPGKILTGLWRSVTKDVDCSPAGSLEKIEHLQRRH
jgi:[acyl-carrier-protein] S-malonyltransferase